MVWLFIILLVILVSILVFWLYMLYIWNEIQTKNEEILEILKKSIEDIDKHVYYFTREIKK